ncbi:MAG TPA: 6-bladed beta-propeller [Parapedobacter sp.]|uniref:6-bladed beta-propeller n=1 Tax=Parapedobacter sp. TaxID=1958893 RepID=UPI002C792B5B|nr:6-bladed beta-propeller [Parapedobacter sp.]HWK59767.1 6-bladed beta-propeller [Parapedobacter sp.]
MGKMKRQVCFFVIVVFFALSCDSSQSRADDIKKRLEGYADLIDEKLIVEGENSLSADFRHIEIPKGIGDSTVDLDRLIKDVRYVKLETHADVLIGRVDKLYFSDDRIIVVDKTKAHGVFIFDHAGKFIAKIQQLGKGPEEYAIIRDVSFNSDSNTIVLYDDQRDQCLHFSEDGVFLKAEKVGFFFHRFEYLAGGLFVHFQGNSVNLHIPSIADNDIVVTNDCKEIIVTFRPHYNQLAGIRNFTSNHELVKSASDVYFAPIFCDTIFNFDIDKRELKASYAVDLGSDDLKMLLNDESTLADYSAAFNTEGVYKFKGKMLPIDDFVFFEGERGGRYMGPWGLFYSRRTGNAMCGVGYAIGQRKDMLYFSFPDAVYKAEFVSVIDPAAVITSRSNSISKREIEHEKLSWVDSLSDIDNPILMFFTIEDF